MSNTKSRTPCFVAGCLIVSIIFVVVVVMGGILFLHIPTAQSFYERSQKQAKLRSVLIESTEAGLDLEPLSERSRNIYLTLQNNYQSREDNEDGSAFDCSAIVEYYSADEAEDSKKYVYGMLIYTDSITTAYAVFTRYYGLASEQGVDFSDTQYFLFVRGNAVFVGNNRAFLKAYMNNLI